MNVAYRWLQDYVKTTTAPEALGEKFRMTSSEMEGLRPAYSFAPEVVSGHVLALKQHPDADRLRVATVDTGDKLRTIVCGAPNISEGQRVIVAKPGAVLTPLTGGTIEIKEAKLRGIMSEGMICAADELGLPADSAGILILDDSVKPGTAALLALGLNDAVIDLEITPNRPDLLSYYGLAREVAAFEKRSLGEIQIASIDANKVSNLSLDARIEDSKLSTRYSALAFEIDEIAPSPWWMQARLLLAGVRPINSVVDVTNYVMLELGQPLHAFDMDKLPRAKRRGMPSLAVRGAKKGERIELLDGTTRNLEEGDVVIADAEDSAIALGGIMGGASSAISDTTRHFVLESAVFTGGSVRRTSRRLGLRSEASLRFEKGLDPEGTVTALKRAAYLLGKISSAKPCSAIADVSKHSYVRPRIHVSFNDIFKLTGANIGAADCKPILLKLGFQLPSFTKSAFDAIAPSWRADVKLAQDVIEELIRIWGFERIPLTLPKGEIQAPEPNPRFEARKSIRHALARLGGYEQVNLPFVSGRSLERLELKLESAVKLPNPLSKEGEYLAPTHLVALLENVSSTNQEFVALRTFEIGKVFFKPHNEKELLSLLLRDAEPSEELVRDAKTLVERALASFDSTETATYADAEHLPPYFIPNASLAVHVGGKPAGFMGFIKPSIVAAHKIRRGKALFFVELDFEALTASRRAPHVYVPEARFPSIGRDVTLLIDKAVPYASVEKAVESARTELLASWNLKDTFSGGSLPEGKKSLTLGFVFASPDRTLEDTEARSALDLIVDRFRAELAATIND